MNLTVIWISFIFFVSVFQELNLLNYLLFSVFILWFTFINNLIKPSQISSNIFFLFCSVPSAIICYITFIYENFLLITLNK